MSKEYVTSIIQCGEECEKVEPDDHDFVLVSFGKSSSNHRSPYLLKMVKDIYKEPLISLVISITPF